MDNTWRFIFICLYLTPFILGFISGYQEVQHVPEPVRVVYVYRQQPVYIQNISTELDAPIIASPKRLEIAGRAWAYNAYLFTVLAAKAPIVVPNLIWFHDQGRLTGLGVQSVRSLGQTVSPGVALLVLFELGIYLFGILSTVELFYDFLVEMMWRKKPLTQRILFKRWGGRMLMGLLALGIFAAIETML